MKFSDIPGHIKTKEALKRLVDNDRIPHAIMLAGPSGIGKMSVARALVQYAHCQAPVDGEPCGKCPACQQHLSFNHPDLHFIYPIVKNKAQKIEFSADRLDKWKTMLEQYPAMPEEKWLEIIEAGNSQPLIYVSDSDYIIRADAYSSYSSKYKFFVIWLPEKLQPAAANKLLKVVEEPTEGTVFIFVSNNPAAVLPTISSRTQCFNMGPVDTDEISSYMQRKFGLDEFRADELAKLARGRISLADELASHSGERAEFGELFRDIMRAAYAKKPAKLKELSDYTAGFGREKIRRFLDYMNTMARENFIYNLRMPQLSYMTPDEANFSSRFSPFIHHGNIEEISAEIDRAKTDVERNGNSKLILFSLFILVIPLLHRKPPA